MTLACYGALEIVGVIIIIIIIIYNIGLVQSLLTRERHAEKSRLVLVSV